MALGQEVVVELGREYRVYRHEKRGERNRRSVERVQPGSQMKRRMRQTEPDLGRAVGAGGTALGGWSQRQSHNTAPRWSDEGKERLQQAIPVWRKAGRRQPPSDERSAAAAADIARWSCQELEVACRCGLRSRDPAAEVSRCAAEGCRWRQRGWTGHGLQDEVERARLEQDDEQ